IARVDRAIRGRVDRRGARADLGRSAAREGAGATTREASRPRTRVPAHAHPARVASDRFAGRAPVGGAPGYSSVPPPHRRQGGAIMARLPGGAPNLSRFEEQAFKGIPAKMQDECAFLIAREFQRRARAAFTSGKDVYGKPRPASAEGGKLYLIESGLTRG